MDIETQFSHYIEDGDSCINSYSLTAASLQFFSSVVDKFHLGDDHKLNLQGIHPLEKKGCSSVWVMRNRGLNTESFTSPLAVIVIYAPSHYSYEH